LRLLPVVKKWTWKEKTAHLYFIAIPHPDTPRSWTTLFGPELPVESDPGALTPVSDFGVHTLLAETAVHIGAKVKVGLACSPEEYRQVSVQHRDPDWLLFLFQLEDCAFHTGAKNDLIPVINQEV
tara:strand:+ start:210 stop:584 length:375 start_codon:yes stop_codon:yes gene_type:complete